MAVIPGGCTSKLQPLDVSINKPSMIKKRYSAYIQTAVVKAAENNDRLKAADKGEVLSWIVDAIEELNTKKDMVKRSFNMWGVSNHRNGCEDHLIRNQDMLQASVGDCYDSSDEEFEGFTLEDIDIEDYCPPQAKFG